MNNKKDSRDLEDFQYRDGARATNPTVTLGSRDIRLAKRKQSSARDYQALDSKRTKLSQVSLEEVTSDADTSENLSNAEEEQPACSTVSVSDQSGLVDQRAKLKKDAIPKSAFL